MTLSEFFVSSYGWADRNAALILLLALVIPAAGTALAWIGKGGRTDTDGRFVASAVMGLAFAGVLLELSAILIAVGLLGTDPDADLTAARKAFAAGDIGRAVSLAESARSAWAGARTVGQIRILGAAAGAAGVLLLLALYVWTRSARPKEKVPVDVESAPAERHDA